MLQPLTLKLTVWLSKIPSPPGPALTAVAKEGMLTEPASSSRVTEFKQANEGCWFTKLTTICIDLVSVALEGIESVTLIVAVPQT